MTAQPLLPLEVSVQASNALAWLHAHAPAGAKLTGDTRRLQPGDVFFAYVLGNERLATCLLYTSPSPRDGLLSRMPSSA